MERTSFAKLFDHSIRPSLRCGFRMDAMRYVLVLVALGGVAGTLDAQAGVRIEPGQRVRVQSVSSSGSFDRGVKGTVERVFGDTLLVVRPDGAGPHQRSMADLLSVARR
jgi:hypothetical protein